MSLIPRYQIRRGTADEWNAANPILLAGEMGLETDTRKLKVGNGVDRWSAIPYIHFDTTITWTTPPTSSTSPGFPGDVAYRDDFFYLRTESGWRQVALQPVSSEIVITQQPADASVADGDTATFSVVASSQEAISYQWSSSSDGVTFTAISGATDSSLTVTADLPSNGLRYRAVLSASGASSVTTNVATLSVIETFRLLTESGSELRTEDGRNINHDGLSIQFFVTITQQPADAVESSGNASFSVSAVSSGGLDLTYQWQKSDDGVTFTNIDGATSQTLNLSGLVFATDNGDQYRVIVDALASDPVTSEAATLTVQQPTLSFSQQPVSTTASDGIATFSSTAIASDGSTVTYQWQLSTDGVNFADIPGKTSSGISLSSLTFEGNNGHQYRVVASSPTTDSLTSNAATLTVQQPAISFVQQPSSVTASGGAASFTALAASSDDSTVAYQWQHSDDGVTFEDIQGADSFELVLSGLTNADDDGDRYRVVASSATTDPLTSNTVTLTVPQSVISFTTLPVNTTSSGGSATFTASAVSSDGSNVAYQWQKSDDGVTFSDVPGETGTTLSLTGLTHAADNGDKYRVVADSPTTNPATSVAVTLTVPQPAITFSQNPTSVTSSGGDAVFTALASCNDGSAVTYQWQRSYEGSAYLNVDGETSATLSLSGLTFIGDNGASYRVIADSPTAAAVASTAATLSVPAPSFEFTQQPLAATSNASGEATFTAAATSSDGAAVDYQWQKSDDGVAFTDVDGATSSTLNLTGLTTADDDGDRYRVTAGVPGGNQITSNTVVLSVPAVTLEFTQQPQNTTDSNGSATFTAAAAETSYGLTVSYQWQAAVLGGEWFNINGETSASLTLTGLTSIDNNKRYRVVATASDVVGDATLASEEARLTVSYLAITQQPQDAEATVPDEWLQAGDSISGEVYEKAGYSVAMSDDGTRMVVGAVSGRDDTNTSTGVARVYDWDGSAWEQVGDDIAGTTSYDLTGWAVAISGDGDRVAVAAPTNSSSLAQGGRVSIYEWSGFTWEPIGNPIYGDTAYSRSGSSVAMSDDGNTVAIGSPYDSYDGANTGKVRVFSWSGAYWSQVGSDIRGEAAGDTAGYSVALSADGQRVAVGAINAVVSPYGLSNYTPTKRGAVRVYDLVGANWVLAGATIGGPPAGNNSQSGYSVSLSSDGNRLAIGAPFQIHNRSQARGQVRVYDWGGSAWSQVGLDIDEPLSDTSGFGWSVSLSNNGSRLAIGVTSPYGSARVFLLTSGVWVQFGDNIAANSEDDSAGFATVISGDGNRIAVGAPYNDLAATNSGRVLVYDLTSEAAATFSVGAFSSDGSEILYQWQRSDDGGVTFNDIAGATSSTYALSVFTSAADDGDQYRVVIDSLTASPITSNAVTLTVSDPVLEIRLQPQDTTAVDGNATFTVVGADVAYYSTVTYQWQLLNGGSWSDLAGETGPSLSLTGLTSSSDGNQYRVVLSAAASAGSSSLNSDAATLTVPYIAISTQPQNTTAAIAGWSPVGNTIYQSIAPNYTKERVSAVSLANNGNWMAVGGEFHQDRGRVRVFYWNGSTWVQLGSDIVGSSVSDSYNSLGKSVALSQYGTRLCIGGKTGFFSSGQDSVRTYALTGPSNNRAWTQDLPDIVGVGTVISLSDDGTRLAVGSPDASSGSFSAAGLARVYERSSTAWTQLGADITGTATGDLCGYSVALSGDGTRLAVGSPKSDAGNPIWTKDIGLVRVFEWSGSAWVQVGNTLYGGSPGHEFGTVLSFSEDGDRLLVASEFYNGGPTGNDRWAGRADVFDWDGSSWTLAGSSIVGDEEGDRLGTSAAISSDGNRIAVGIPSKTVNALVNGVFQLYEWNGTDWDQVGGDAEPEGYDENGFGFLVAISRDGKLVASAGLGDTNGYARVTRLRKDASFTVQASTNDGSTITVQWQKSDNGGAFADIPGATSGTLSLTNVGVTADNGDQYRAVLDSPTTDPVTSNSATLTVT